MEATTNAWGIMSSSKYIAHRSRLGLLVLLLLVLGACASSPPRNVANACDIFQERRAWYKDAARSERRWGIPIGVNLAFIYQESSFQARVKPARSRFLWIFPGPRPSSAYGYAQALDSTWAEYVQASGNKGASRADFGDAVDFIAWYNAGSVKQSHIDRSDARDLYFAYHEGNGGYQRGTHRSKEWLLSAAGRVQSNADRFTLQLDQCRRELDKNWLQRLLF